MISSDFTKIRVRIVLEFVLFYLDSSNTAKDAPSDQGAFEVRTHLQIDTGIKGLRLQIAMRTQDIGKTSQDRTHVFLLNHRESNMEGKVIHNLNVRGKRGNIVQTFPATEYDFYPTDLKMATEDLVHIQWTGEFLYMLAWHKC